MSGVRVTPEQMAHAADALDEPVIRIQEASLPAALRGTAAARVLAEVGLPQWLGDTVSFHERPRPRDSGALVCLGMANLYELCVDPATGEVVAYDHRRGRRQLNTSMGAFVDTLHAMMTEVERLQAEGRPPTPSARWRFAAALREADPDVEDSAVYEWWLIFGDWSSEYLGRERPDPDSSMVDLNWSDGELTIDVTVHRDDAAQAEDTRRRFGHFVALLERVPPGGGRRDAIIEALHQNGGSAWPHPAILMSLDPTRMDGPIQRRAAIAVSAFLGWSELLPMLDALRSNDPDADVRADAGFAYRSITGP
jgi:hypothetical protein